MEGIAQFFVEGGIWMLPIAFCSMLVVAVVVERLYALYIVHSQDARVLFSSVKKDVEAGNLSKAIQQSSKKPDSALSVLYSRVLSSIGKSEEDIRLSVEEGVTESVPMLQKRSHTLSGLASLATLLGLLGTVMGLIEAFSVVADAPPDQKSVLLTRAISIAMNCTAFGLMVAIPAMFFQLLVSGSVKKLVDDVDTSSLKLENLLLAQRVKK
ncbi:MAG: MotA/TolQ/ExbB proton channel family protein [Deltaproteobacteria bacterium]|nr:MotA/TolQ/ExbB proton channel family protein [Deltaproteobacteria bacterium]